METLPDPDHALPRRPLATGHDLWSHPGFRRLLVTGIALLVAAAASFSGTSQFLDEQARTGLDRLFSRAATGQVHVIEVDARSIAAFKAWPWPRRRHAELIRTLNEAHASTVAFDVDFSSPSDPEQDAALASALDAFGGTVVLPTFRQRASGNSATMVESLPIPMLRKHAFTGSVNVHPDTDGTLRSYSFGTVTQGVPRPSLAAMLADVQGEVSTGFLVDTAIDPASIPRHSYIDVVTGKVPADVLKGKRILVGATAIELGDRYVIPTHGTLPGVVVQALAAETLIQGRNHPDLGSAIGIALALIGGIFALMRQRDTLRIAVFAATATIVIACSVIFDVAGIGQFGMASGLILIAAIAALNLLFDMLDELWTSRFVDARSGLAGERMLVSALRQNASGQLVVMQFRRGQETIDVLDGALRQKLFGQIAERVRLATGPVTLFGLGSNGLAWRVTDMSDGALMDNLDGIAALFLTHFDVQGRSIVIVPVFGTTRIGNNEPRRALGQALLAASRASGSSLRALAFSDALEQGADLDQRILAEFDAALADGQVHLVFQAKLAIAEKRVAGFEALARWTHPELGPIPPDQFVPVLEEAGRMSALTLFGIRESFARMAAWREESFDLSVAVNVSAPLLNDRSFAKQTLKMIEEAGELASRLVLEITESAAFERQEAALAFLAKVRERGVKVSVDDYGTGQSTMTYLKTFPADEIKIDKSFITNLPTSASDQILVRSTIDLAHELGFKVVAEGVETEEILAMLASYGCDTAQGWHIARPLPAQRLLDAQRYPAKLLPANERQRAA